MKIHDHKGNLRHDMHFFHTAGTDRWTHKPTYGYFIIPFW